LVLSIFIKVCVSISKITQDMRNTAWFLVTNTAKTVLYCSVLAVLVKTAKTKRTILLHATVLDSLPYYRACIKIFIRQSCCSQWHRAHRWHRQLWPVASSCNVISRQVYVKLSMLNWVNWRKYEQLIHWYRCCTMSHSCGIVIYRTTITLTDAALHWSGFRQNGWSRDREEEKTELG